MTPAGRDRPSEHGRTTSLLVVSSKRTQQQCKLPLVIHMQATEIALQQLLAVWQVTRKCAGGVLPCAAWQALQPYLAALARLCWRLQAPHQKPCAHWTRCPGTPCLACQPPGCSCWMLSHTLPAAPCKADCQSRHHDANK